MSGTFPVTKFTSVDISSETPTMSTKSISGIVQRKQIATQYWKLRVKFPTLSTTDVRAVMAFLAKQRNNLNDWTIAIDEFSKTNGDIALVALANPLNSAIMTVPTGVAAGVGAITFDTTYDSALFTGAMDATAGLRSGDFIKFSGHTKVYQVTDDVTFDATGSGTINFFPNLFNAVPNTDTIVYDAVPMNVILEGKNQKYGFSMAGATSKSKLVLKLREAI